MASSEAALEPQGIPPAIDGQQTPEQGENGEPGKGKKKQKVMLSSYTLLIIIVAVVGIATVVLSLVTPEVTAASLSDVLSSPIQGFIDGIEISLFLLIMGGCLGLVNKLGALDAGIAALVGALNGRENLLIAAVMAVFAVLGSSYGFCEETIPFYGLMAATMFAAGFDTMVACATVLLGAGVGCLGSTVNPFAVGVAIDALKDAGVECSEGPVIAVGAILCVLCYAVALFYTLRYANKVRRDKGSTILSLQEQQECEAAFGSGAKEADAAGANACAEGGGEGGAGTLEFTRSRKVALALFGIAFAVMICGFIPWGEFGMGLFDLGGVYDEASGTWTTLPWSALLTGAPLGEWYFKDASIWFLVMAIVIGVAGRLSEGEIVDGFLDGASDMIGVALMVGLSRAISILMGQTGLDTLILDGASGALAGTPGLVFGPLCFMAFLGLSLVITSTSALATISMPLLGTLAANLGFAPEAVVSMFCAANGVANLFTPAAVFLPGLVLARVKYTTWLKWAVVPIVVIGVVSIVVCTAALMLV